MSLIFLKFNHVGIQSPSLHWLRVLLISRAPWTRCQYDTYSWINTTPPSASSFFHPAVNITFHPVVKRTWRQFRQMPSIPETHSLMTWTTPFRCQSMKSSTGLKVFGIFLSIFFFQFLLSYLDVVMFFRSVGSFQPLEHSIVGYVSVWGGMALIRDRRFFIMLPSKGYWDQEAVRFIQDCPGPVGGEWKKKSNKTSFSICSSVRLRIILTASAAVVRGK